MFMSQGRWLTGLLFEKLFGSISTVSDIKYLRIFSFIGWLLLFFLWQFVFSVWIKKIDPDKNIALPVNFYFVCAIPVAVYVGWASCMEFFLSTATALISGYFLFQCLFEIKVSKIILLSILALLAGIASLFLHQSSFGIFLFPFFLLFLKEQNERPLKKIATGIGFYLFIYIIYYFLFQYSLQLNEAHADSRVGISMDIPGKTSFLFSDPLPASFSTNILYSSRSIFSQVLAPLIMVAWAVSVFVRFGKKKVTHAFLHIIFVMLFLVLMYIPSMIALENFASYRTLFAFNLAVFYLLASQSVYFCKTGRARKVFVNTLCCFVVITGFYNYNFQLVNPLKSEYKAFTNFMKKNMTADKQTVYFIRADRFMFNSFFHSLPYKDEFGLPSTNKDWVPEPLIKQYLLESTGSREIAEKTKVIQFADSTEYNNAHIQLSKNDLLLDINKVFKEYMLEK